MNWETYIAFGDSITIGARSYLGYPEIAGKFLQEASGKKWNVVNHATSGFTAIDLVRSVESSFSALKSHNAGVCTVLIGTNDLKNNTTAADFEIAVSLLLTKIRLISSSGRIKVLGIPLFPKGIMYPYDLTMNDKIPAYNAVLRTCAQSHGCEFHTIEIREQDLFDGVHLNTQGCEHVARQVAKLVLADRGL